jgi:hypothetical protein
MAVSGSMRNGGKFEVLKAARYIPFIEKIMEVW